MPAGMLFLGLAIIALGCVFLLVWLLWRTGQRKSAWTESGLSPLGEGDVAEANPPRPLTDIIEAIRRVSQIPDHQLMSAGSHEPETAGVTEVTPSPSNAPDQELEIVVANETHAERQFYIRQLRPGEPVDLLRDTDNLYDEHAVKIVSRLGVIGYVPRRLAARLAPLLDNGARTEAVIGRIVAGTKNNPNLAVFLEARIWE